jgi:hypothetical protein
MRKAIPLDRIYRIHRIMILTQSRKDAKELHLDRIYPDKPGLLRSRRNRIWDLPSASAGISITFRLGKGETQREILNSKH